MLNRLEAGESNLVRVVAIVAGECHDTVDGEVKPLLKVVEQRRQVKKIPRPAHEHDAGQLSCEASSEPRRSCVGCDRQSAGGHGW